MLEEANEQVKISKGKPKTAKEIQKQPVALSAGAWERPMQNQQSETGVMLTAILKAIDTPTSIRTVRLAAVLALEPRFLLPYLDLAQAATWRHNVGSQAEPRHGDIVIAGINGQKTVKRLFINGDSVRLMPENKNYQPIIVKTIDELSIWGVVTFVVSRPR